MLMELLTEDPPKVAVFGPTYNEHLDITAQIAPYYNIVQVRTQNKLKDCNISTGNKIGKPGH